MNATRPTATSRPIRVPQPLTAGARAHRRDHASSSACSRRSSSASATCGSFTDAARAVIAAASPSASAPPRAHPVRGLRGGRAVRPRGRLLRGRRAGRRAVGATSSPRPRSARCSAPCWPAPSTRGGTSRAGPPVRRGRRRRRARHAGPRRAGRPAGRGRRRRPPLRRRRAVGGPAGGARRPGRGLRRGVPDEPFVGRRGRQRAARQPALPPRGPRRRMAGGVRRRRRAAARPVEVLVPSRALPAVPAGGGGARGPGARPGRAARWVRDVVARLRPPGRLVVHRLRVVDGGHGGAAVAGVAADLPGPPAGRALPGRPGRRTSPATSPSTSSRRPPTTSTQAEFLRRARPRRARGGGAAEWAAQAAAPDLAALTARSRVREAEALTDPAGLGGFTVAEWLVA